MLTIEQQSKKWDQLQFHTAKAKEISNTLLLMLDANHEVASGIERLVKKIQAKAKI